MIGGQRHHRGPIVEVLVSPDTFTPSGYCNEYPSGIPISGLRVEKRRVENVPISGVSRPASTTNI